MKRQRAEKPVRSQDATDEAQPRAATSKQPQPQEEEGFPRGGRDPLSARERREVHAAAEAAVEKELAAASPLWGCMVAIPLHLAAWTAAG